ncbi:MAG: copper chaperone PCu(A)C [Acidimicrobiia bacterium]
MTRRLLMALVALALVAAACGGGDGAVAVEDPWARNSPAMATAGAVYMDLTADADDALVGASVDDSIAAVVEIHETSAMGEDDGGGMMQMSPVEAVALPAGETVNLEPGGFHVMLLDLAAPLEVGDTFELTLEFESGESQTVEVEVRES